MTRPAQKESPRLLQQPEANTKNNDDSNVSRLNVSDVTSDVNPAHRRDYEARCVQFLECLQGLLNQDVLDLLDYLPAFKMPTPALAAIHRAMRTVAATAPLSQLDPLQVASTLTKAGAMDNYAVSQQWHAIATYTGVPLVHNRNLARDAAEQISERYFCLYADSLLQTHPEFYAGTYRDAEQWLKGARESALEVRYQPFPGFTHNRKAA
ncbi:hypothetical protein [Corynebacterium hindlerae]|uniref:hypothetical protein n=1 Tax=Corynebacterium hindlerae TaxID=699041 RepID=UPI003AAAB3CD